MSLAAEKSRASSGSSTRGVFARALHEAETKKPARAAAPKLPDAPAPPLHLEAPPSERATGRAAIARALLPDAPAIAGTRALITALEKQIRTLEDANRAKTIEIDALLAQIRARRAEIQRAYENKRQLGIFGVLLGAPMVGVASLVMMQNDDARLRELNASLARAEGERGSIDRRIADYGATKARVTATLAGLQQAEAALAADRPAAAGAGGLRGDVAAIAEHADALRRALLLITNLDAQVSALTELRDAAAQLGLHLDALLAELRGALDRANQAAEASERELGRLINIMLDANPNAAARSWIMGELRSRVRERVREGVEALLRHEQVEEPARGLLRDRLVSLIMNGLQIR